MLGSERPLAHPALVWDLAIGQSTLLTGRVIANLFYRGLLLQRAPVIGDTLVTTTEVVGAAPDDTAARPRRERPGRAPRPHRRPGGSLGARLLALRDAAAARPGRADRPRRLLRGDPRRAGPRTPCGRLLRPGAWTPLRTATASRSARLAPGARTCAHAADVVSGAPELARLTLNVAGVHHDRHRHPGGRRLVYGGHTIGLAAAQATRAIPEIATIVGWHSCEHLAPVHEGDTLRSEIELERIEPLPAGGALAHLRSRVSADREPAQVEVLDWRFVALVV